MRQSLVVSVSMITYAHEKYIRQAIEGVLMQECDFEIELIIANDCSPDDTELVIQDILNSHPRAAWIKYFSHEKNLGIQSNALFTLNQCKGKYIAVCEGDDYWTDPLKLQKQVDFLENNFDYVLCFHQVNILMPNGSIVDDFITKVPENYETIETLARLGNYIHTPSVVFRNIIKEFPLEYKLSPIGDYFLYMMLAEYGKLKYLEEKMVVYRYGVGVHSSNSRKNASKNSLKFFICIFSYLKNKELKEYIFERQLQSISELERIIKEEFEDYSVSNIFFKKIIKSVKHSCKQFFQ